MYKKATFLLFQPVIIHQILHIVIYTMTFALEKNEL